MKIPPRVAATIVSLLILTAAYTVSAQFPFSSPGELVQAETFASLNAFHPGSSGHIAIRVTVKDGWHINSNRPLDEYLIPTVLEVNAPDGITVTDILYPEAELAKLEISDKKMSLYHGTVVLGAGIAIDETTLPGEYTVRLVVKYQGCNNMTCLEPSSAAANITIRVAAQEDFAELTHEELFASPPFTGTGHAAGPDEGDQSFIDLIEQRGLILAFIFIFLGGLALNLTPCVYPLIPITVSYFGGQSEGKTSRSFVLALFYVLGMSITYSVLGMIAATTGGLFGSVLQNPLVILFIAAVLIGLATSMFGLWEFRLPTFLTRRTGTAKKGRWGALLMGLTVGIVAAPCIGPFVLGLLTYVGEIGKPVTGFFMFFTLAWGMGTPFIVLGTISGSISKLPQSGHWMVWVRKIFGFILIAMAIYFARHLLGPMITSIGYILTALTAGLFLGWFDRTPQTGRGFAVLKKTVAIIWLAIAAVILVMPGGPFRATHGSDGIEWEPFSRELLAGATEDGKPVIIDFSADWCIPCRELEHKTFNDRNVMDYSENFVTLKVDLTRIGSREKELKKDFDIRGVPTIIFLDTSGEEPEGTRITGFVKPDRFLETMKKAHQAK
jgi:thiol:disulfide interchange protein DsbD